MSYATMDHAGWVEENLSAWRKMVPAKRRAASVRGSVGYAGAPETLSPFQRRAFDILGIVAGGIYNAPFAWNSVDWDCGGGLAVVWRGELATFDGQGLTMLVYLCHEARIRCSVSPAARDYLRIMMHPRSHDADAGMPERHPNMAEAINGLRAYIAEDHPLVYRAERDDTMPARRLAWLRSDVAYFAARLDEIRKMVQAASTSERDAAASMARRAARDVSFLTERSQRLRRCAEALGTAEADGLASACEAAAAEARKITGGMPA